MCRKLRLFDEFEILLSHKAIMLTLVVRKSDGRKRVMTVTSRKWSDRAFTIFFFHKNAIKSRIEKVFHSHLHILQKRWL